MTNEFESMTVDQVRQISRADYANATEMDNQAAAALAYVRKLDEVYQVMSTVAADIDGEIDGFFGTALGASSQGLLNHVSDAINAARAQPEAFQAIAAEMRQAHIDIDAETDEHAVRRRIARATAFYDSRIGELKPISQYDGPREPEAGRRHDRGGPSGSTRGIPLEPAHSEPDSHDTDLVGSADSGPRLQSAAPTASPSATPGPLPGPSASPAASVPSSSGIFQPPPHSVRPVFRSPIASTPPNGSSTTGNPNHPKPVVSKIGPRAQPSAWAPRPPQKTTGPVIGSRGGNSGTGTNHHRSSTSLAKTATPIHRSEPGTRNPRQTKHSSNNRSTATPSPKPAQPVTDGDNTLIEWTDVTADVLPPVIRANHTEATVDPGHVLSDCRKDVNNRAEDELKQPITAPATSHELPEWVDPIPGHPSVIAGSSENTESNHDPGPIVGREGMRARPPRVRYSNQDEQ